MSGPAIGGHLHGWTRERVEDLSELGCTGDLWRHDRTGAELISVAQPLEQNKTFGVMFRTPPEDSTGVAHVLEHSVLCGSRKYPVKEPFVELLKSSMQTFLNAMTYPDRTLYPVASCNLQDFYNLVDVYLDAVFHPRAISDPRVLAQEGWHYEIESKEQPLSFKGVVFNEMKGVYSNPDSVQGRVLLNKLFPDTPYSVDSGGDPAEIPNLTFEYFTGFHHRYYHPSNARFWFYGDDPPEHRLRMVDEYLRDFGHVDARSHIPLQPLWREPRRVLHEFAVGANEDSAKKAMVVVSWVLLRDRPDLETAFALEVLDYVLMGTPAAPLRKALTDSGLGSRVLGGGLDDSLAQPTFAAGLKDIREEDAEMVERIIMDTLAAAASSGLEPESVEAALSKIEFGNRELNTGGLPRGLALLFSVAKSWNYEKDPFEALRFDAPLRALRLKLIEQRQPILESLIRTVLLENPHRLSVVSVPSTQEGPKRDEAELARLGVQKEKLSEQEVDALIAETCELRQLQETPDTPQALAAVPHLRLADLPRTAAKVPTEYGTLNTATVLRHALPTAGVVYVDVAFDLGAVPAELLPLLPLFCRGLRQMGTARSDFVQLQRRVDLATGGISASPVISAKRGSEEPMAVLLLRGKAMETKAGALLEIMAELATSSSWGRERFMQLARESHSNQRSALLSAGHTIAAARIGRQFTIAGWANEQLSGLSQFEFLAELLGRIDREWPAVEAQIRELQACIFSKACTVNLTADASALTGLDEPVRTFLEHLPAETSRRPAHWRPALPAGNEGIVVPSQVNYVGKGSNLYRRAGYRLHGSALVASKLLGTTWLWDRVRVSGGAYGGFCSFDIRSGDFRYLSYRDPNLLQTMEVYDAAAGFLRDLDLSEDDLAKAIIGTIGDVDAYQLPDAKGYTALLRHLLGETDDMRQQLREEILATTKADLLSFADVLETVVADGAICAVGGEEAVRAATGPLSLVVRSPLAEARSRL